MILRLERDYNEAIKENVTDEEIYSILIEIQGNLDLHLFNIAQDSGWHTYLIRALADLTVRDTAVVRLAKQIEKTHFYGKLQETREKVH